MQLDPEVTKEAIKNQLNQFEDLDELYQTHFYRAKMWIGLADDQEAPTALQIFGIGMASIITGQILADITNSPVLVPAQVIDSLEQAMPLVRKSLSAYLGKVYPDSADCVYLSNIFGDAKLSEETLMFAEATLYFLLTNKMEEFAKWKKSLDDGLVG